MKRQQDALVLTMGVRSQAQFFYLNNRYPLHQPNWSFLTRLEVSTLALPRCAAGSEPAEGFGDVPHADNPAGSIGSDDENLPDFYSGDPGSFDGGDKPGLPKAPHHHVCDVEKTMEQRILDGDLIVPVDAWHHLPTYGSTIMSTEYVVQYRSVSQTCTV